MNCRSCNQLRKRRRIKPPNKCLIPKLKRLQKQNKQAVGCRTMKPWKMLLQNSFQYRKTLKRMSLLWLTLQKLRRRNGQKVSTVQIRIGWRKVLTEIQRFPMVCSPVIQMLQPSILQKRSNGRYLRQVIWQKAWFPRQLISCC